jgi:hypothetical protein
MARGKPVKNAPGWRVIERPGRWRRRPGVTILGVAVGLLLVVAAAHRYQVGWPADHRSQAAAPSVARVQAPPERATMPGPTSEASPGMDAAGITIHYPAHGNDAVTAIRFAALLQTRGFPVADIRLVEVEIEQPSVRYFFAGDRAESRHLVDVMSTLSVDQAPDQATDYSHVRRKPRPGSIELWLPAVDRTQMAQRSAL